MKISDCFGKEYDVNVEKLQYPNGNLAIELVYYDEEDDFWESYGTLTTNFDEKLPDGYAYVDTNNIPFAEEFIEKYGLGVHQGKFRYSGFCTYPLYKFF